MTQGARLASVTSTADVEIAGFNENPTEAPTPAMNFVAPLTHFSLLSASGVDAAAFLHSQFTNDVNTLGQSQARLAGYCTPKGRLLATFLMWKTADQILLQIPQAIRPTFHKRLQMFVMRAKVSLAEKDDALAQLGLAGRAAADLLQKWFPSLPAEPYQTVDGVHGTLIRLADSAAIDDPTAAGVSRYLWVLPIDLAIAIWPDLVSALKPVGMTAWQLSDIRAAIPTVTDVTQDKFVPQMINFEAVGGVSFQKGCYPGQEIVARSQYLGKLKRRMLPAVVASADVVAGTEVFSSADPDQASGMIVNAATIEPGRSLCLVELKLAALGDDVHLGSASGPVLQFLKLPYELADPDRPDLR